MNDARHPHDPEEIECRTCGTTFDLARQNYYADECPSCYDHPNPDRYTISCAHPHCETEKPPEEMTKSRKASPIDARGPAYVCSEHADYSARSRGL